MEYGTGVDGLILIMYKTERNIICRKCGKPFSIKNVLLISVKWNAAI